MKNIKKILASALSASMLFSGAAAIAAPQSTEDIQILYNTGYIDAGDTKPINKDGRVMIPFRAALEQMGATVDYEDTTKLVTAKKDETTIKFTLLDDTIYIDNSGVSSELKMDVPMIVENDRTLVPIRFISSALGMNVGWDGDRQAVLIMDAEALSEELHNAMPNMRKLTELQKAANYNEENIEFTIAVKAEALELTVDASMDYKKGTNVQGLTLNIKNLSFNAGGETVKLENAKAECVIAGGKIYIKTDAVEKAAKSVSSPALTAAAAMMKRDTWFNIDVAAMLDNLPLPDTMKNMYIGMLSTGEVDLDTMLDNAISVYIPDADETLTYTDMIKPAMMINIYKKTDKCISVTEKEGKAYSVALKMDTKDLEDIVYELGSYSSVEDDGMEHFADVIKLNMDVKSDADENNLNSAMNLKIDLDGSGVSFEFNMTDTAKTNENLEEPEIPSDSQNINELLSILQ